MKWLDDLMDKSVAKDGVVSSSVAHIAVYVGIALGVFVLLKIIGVLLFPTLIGGGIYLGYKSWKADQRINGDK
jgi:hypothetical protein